MGIIEDKDRVFAKASIMAIIDSEPCDLYHRAIMISDDTSKRKNSKLMIFAVGNQVIYFQWMTYPSVWLFIKLQITRLVLAQTRQIFPCD